MIRSVDVRQEGSLTRTLWDFDPIEEKITQYWEFDTKKTIFDSVLKSSNPMFCLFDGDKPLAFFGVSIIRPGVGEIWVIRGKDAVKYPRVLVTYAKKFIDDLLDSDMFFRIEAAVLPKWGKWARTIGLDFEHICKKYDGYNDHEVYVRLKCHQAQPQQ